jgi:hypothetical protein
MNIIDNDLELLKKSMLEDAKYNLNKWKRIAGDECDEAIQHFYEVVAPDQRLKELSRLMGVNFVPWGTIHDGVVHGGRYQGEWVNLGIRWHRDRTTWNRETSTNVKNVATANGNKAKPHISVMFEDAELFDFFEKTPNPNPKNSQDKYLYRSRSGGRQKTDGEPNYTFNKKMLIHPVFQKAILIPLEIVIRGLPNDVKGGFFKPMKVKESNTTGSLADGLIAAEDSMFHSENTNDIEHGKNCIEEKERFKKLEFIGREILSKWGI